MVLDVILDEGCDEEIAVVIALEQNNVNTGSADGSFFVLTLSLCLNSFFVL